MTGTDRMPVAAALLRLLAAGMVVIFHHGIWDARHLGSPLALEPPGSIAAGYGMYGFDLWLVVAGYLTFRAADGRDWRSFAVDRLSRIYPALLVCCMVSIAVIGLWGMLAPGEMPRLRTCLGNLSLLSFATAFIPGFSGAGYVDPSYWVLSYELLWCLLVGAWLARGTVAGSQRPLAALTVVSAVLWCVLWSGRAERIGEIGRFLPYLLLGAQIHLLAARGATAPALACALADGALVLLSVYHRAVGGLGHHDNPLGHDPLLAMGIVASGVGALCAGLRLRMAPTAITVLGAAALPLLLVHDKAGVAVAQHLPWMRGAFGLIALGGGTLLACWAFSRWIEPCLSGWLRASLDRSAPGPSGAA